MRKNFINPERTKKRINWLGFIVISVYILVLILLIFAVFSAPNPRYSFWSFAAVIWVIPGCVLPYATYLFILRAVLSPTKERAIVLSKTSEDDERWNDGYTVTVKVPILVFQLDSGAQLTSRVSHKLYNSLQCGDTGILIYKKRKSEIFFIDFMRD